MDQWQLPCTKISKFVSLLWYQTTTYRILYAIGYRNIIYNAIWLLLIWRSYLKKSYTTSMCHTFMVYLHCFKSNPWTLYSWRIATLRPKNKYLLSFIITYLIIYIIHNTASYRKLEDYPNILEHKDIDDKCRLEFIKNTNKAFLLSSIC